nr:methyltransferase domain-containing protein [Calditrichia bacterium]
MTDLNNPSASEHQPQVEKSADRNQKRQAGEKPSISARLIQTSADLDRQIEVWKDHEQGVRFLRIGFNLSPIEGALTIDLAAVKNGQATLSQNLPIPGNVVAGVVLENCLEHLGVGSALALLRECRRVLAPEGAMQILTPDMDKILDTLRDGSWRDYREKDSLTTWTDNSSEWLSHAFSHYKCLFNRESLEDLITQVGLVPIPAEENDEHASADRDPNFLEVTCYWPERDSEEEPLVSILVPAYKADYLRETLESALNQSYQNIEVVVCDDSDEEAVAAVVAEFRNDNRIRYVNNEGNIGGRANYLKVFSLAKGEYVKFLNDDDRLHPEAVARMAAILRDRPEIALVTSYRRLIDQDGNALPDRHFNSPIVGEDCRIDGVLAVNALLNACVNYIGEPSTTLFRRRDLEGAKPHIMSYRGRPAPRNGDVTMWVNLLGKGDLVYLVDPLSEFRLHEKQRSKQDEYATRAVEAWRQLYQDAKAAGFLSPDAPQALLAAPLDNVHGVKWAYAIASPQNEAPPAGLEKAAPPQRLSERARPEYPRLVPEKLSLIDLALQRYPIKSLADLGGVWGVDGGYTFYALEHGQLDKMVLVDTKINEAVQARQEDYPQLSLKTGNFGEVDPAQTIGEVDAILLYDVLLHQVKPNWDAVLERYAPHTGHFIIYNQQFIKGDKTQRLLELGAEEYFHNVPHNPTEGFYPDLFNKLDEPHPDHPGRTYRDIHNIWQWGIVDGDLYNKLRELGFVMDFYQDCGQFGRLENFHNHAFLFRKDPEAAAQAPDFPEALAALRAPAPRESESRPKRPGGGKNMKEDWNARAVENARYYVRSTDRNQSEAEFDGSGEQNVREYVLVDRELIAPDGDLRNKRMLEIGCGIGRMTKHLATHFGEVVGIDVSGEMIRQGKSRLADVPNATLLETSGSDLGDFDDNSFDFVFSFIVFQHIPDKAVIFNYIRETMRVLKKGGIFKFQVQGDNSIEYQQVEKDTWMGANISPEEIEALSRELGFEILKTGGLGKQYAWYTVRNTGVRVVPVDENPVFVMGCHRSGTSALSIAIGQHSQATPGP